MIMIFGSGIPLEILCNFVHNGYMAVKTLTAGKTLHEKGRDTVSTVEVLVKGKVKIDNGLLTLTASTGAILGIAERPGMPYAFSYTATEDCQLVPYTYNSMDDIAAVIRSNGKIAPILATEAVRLVMEALNIRFRKFSQVHSYYEDLLHNYAEYPSLCAEAGEYPEPFEEMKHLLPPTLIDGISEWEVDYVRGMIEHADVIRSQLYAVSPELSAGAVMYSAGFYGKVAAALVQIYDQEELLQKESAPFRAAYHLMKARAVEKQREDGALDEHGEAPAIENALDTILSYAGADPKITEEFRKGVLQFRENDNRYASTDEARTFRRGLGKLFYDIYFAAFLKSMQQRDDASLIALNNAMAAGDTFPPGIPPEVKMFLQFGFIDEVLAGKENTSILYSIIRSYRPDEDGLVLTAYEWLQKVYRLEVEPSRNEFDQDYQTWLRELKTSGDKTEAQISKMKNDPESRFFFEARNLFTIGGRITFGHAASFVPFFDRQNALRPLTKSYLNAARIKDAYNRFRAIDFSLFSRQRTYYNAELGNYTFHLDEEVLPYVILTPVTGFRGCLWQEIEGKDRGTPARMLLPIVFTEEPETCMLRLAGEFRWEMCKTIQGVHWNDVSDPSLTALYCDYLQFYKKNRGLSEENKQKLKMTLKKYSNDYRNVFIGDYMTYILYESGESPRLNKVSREILFTFCPFPKAVREKLADNPQYRDLIRKYETKQQARIRPIAAIVKKLQKDGARVPEELLTQLRVMQQ